MNTTIVVGADGLDMVDAGSRNDQAVRKGVRVSLRNPLTFLAYFYPARARPPSQVLRVAALVCQIMLNERKGRFCFWSRANARMATAKRVGSRFLSRVDAWWRVRFVGGQFV